MGKEGLFQSCVFRGGDWAKKVSEAHLYQFSSQMEESRVGSIFAVPTNLCPIRDADLA